MMQGEFLAVVPKVLDCLFECTLQVRQAAQVWHVADVA